MKVASRIRLDQLLLQRGLAPSLERARAMILEGQVLVQDQPAQKAGAVFPSDVTLRLRRQERQWVSRGAYKLLTAIQSFCLDLSDRVCLDVGASTGGFTDVMIRSGAAKVYALDVAYGQLAWELRQHPRVAVMERFNAKAMTPEHFDPRPSFGACDASFISLKQLLPPMAAVLVDGGETVVLVKPQFEAPRDKVSKGGLVLDAQVHRAVLEDLARFVADQTPFGLIGAAYSSIRGPRGNIEFLYHLRKGASQGHLDLEELVALAHKNFIGHEVTKNP